VINGRPWENWQLTAPPTAGTRSSQTAPQAHNQSKSQAHSRNVLDQGNLRTKECFEEITMPLFCSKLKIKKNEMLGHFARAHGSVRMELLIRSFVVA
jgi:hypothetical protein